MARLGRNDCGWKRMVGGGTLAVALGMGGPSPLVGQGIVHEVVTGLRSPARLLALETGVVLVAEAGNGPNTGRVSLIDRDRRRVTLIDRLPSGFHGPALDPSGPSGLLLVGQRLYILIGNGDVSVVGPAQGSELPNPNPSSPLFSALLMLEMDGEGRFPTDLSLPREWHARIAGGETAHLTNGRGEVGRLSLVADFEDIPEPRPDVPANIRISNPYGLTGNASGIDVIDAARNLLWRVDLGSRTVRQITTFARVPNPAGFGPPTVEAVPASVRAFRDDLLVSYLTGFPFGAGAASIRRVDRRTGEQTPIVTGLQTAIDVLPVTRGRGSFYVLEFSRNLPTRLPGRLIRIDDPAGAPLELAPALPTPTGMAIDPRSGDMLVTDFSGGRLLLVQLP